LKYAGHTGSGFNQRLERVIRLLKPLETSTPPFSTGHANERAHWTKPSLVAQLSSPNGPMTGCSVTRSIWA
jgi:hypothetical protein